MLVPLPRKAREAEGVDEACILRAHAVDLGVRSGRHWLVLGTEALTEACHARFAALGPPARTVAWAPGPDRSIE